MTTSYTSFLHPNPNAVPPYYGVRKCGQSPLVLDTNNDNYLNSYGVYPPTLPYLQQPTQQQLINSKNLIGVQGGPNPKTNIAPIIAAPSHDITFWRTDNTITNSRVNEQIKTEKYQSGYTTQDYYKKAISTGISPNYNINNGEIRENYGEFGCCGNNNTDTPLPTLITPKTEQREYFNYPEGGKPQSSYQTLGERNGVMEYDNPTQSYPINNYQLTNADNDQVNTANGYNPTQISSNLPVNYPAGNCNKNPMFNDYNRNLFTQTIQPGIYSQNDVLEPINSNIGISWNQQFEPVKKEIKNGTILFHELDGLQNPQQPKQVYEGYNPPNHTVSNDNIYNPRYMGYGDNNRAYIEPTTGQLRYVYADIDAVRMPNYVCRSNVDIIQGADTYETIPDGNSFGNPDTNIIREKMNNAFLDNAMKFRTEIQERAMRKMNANGWQRRVAPLRNH